MKPGIPWSVKGIEPEVREVAKHAAKRAGMTLGEWLNSVILDQDPSGQPPQQPETEHVAADNAPRSVEPPPAPQLRQEPRMRDERPRPSEPSLRLEDIANQLSMLAQREKEAATIQAYEPPRPRHEDRDTLNRILARIDSNEQQAVEAFTAVNERLSVLGRQIAMTQRPQVIEKPEDVPGFQALEAAIRNVVEHIEVSEKRTRDSLKSMQDRLASMAERATSPANPDDLLKTAPAFSNLESRMAELAGRIQRSENLLHAGLPDLVRKEINQLADRIESVRSSAEAMASQAQTAAAGIARNELRDIEARILGVLKEAQATIGSQSATAQDLNRLRGEIGSLNKRMDDMKSSSASERDVHALRVAVEQLSTRVAQGPDMRPIAEMDRRLGELTRKLDQNSAATRNLPQFNELERRIAELDHRLGEAMRLQGDQAAIQSLEQHLAAVNDRVGHTEQQLGHLETMERAIHQLYESLEQNRSFVSQTAEDAANRAVERVLASQAAAGPSPELRALEDGLKAVRESAASAEQRNQETLEAVHETLEQIVAKLAELETASAGHQLAANMAAQAAIQAQVQAPAPVQPEPPRQMAAEQAAPQFYDPAGAFDTQIFVQPQEAPRQAAPAPAPQPEFVAEAPLPPAMEAAAPVHSGQPDFAAGGHAGAAGDDFIAAARRAAQAAATRPSVLHPEVRPTLKPAGKSGFSFSLPFLKGKEKLPEPITYTNGRPVIEKTDTTANDNKRKKLVLAGIVLLAAVSAFAFNILAKPKTKQVTSLDVPAAVETVTGTPATTKPAATSLPEPDLQDLQSQAGLADAPTADMLQTGSIPARKTDATLTSIVGQPAASRAEMPPPEAGPQALREAAARGDAKAQFIIASRYLDGQSVTQDLTKAAYWYQQSAQRGLAPAQYRLATLFERGRGVPKDVATALLWYERAAEGGNIKAMHNAAVIAAGGQAGTPNYDKAFRWFKAAAERGLHDSQFNLAVLHERGLGTRVDKEEAYFWYTLAAYQGDSDAAKRAENIAKALGAEQIAAASARAKGFTPVPGDEAGNVVAVTDPVWNEAPAEAASVPDALGGMAPEAEPVMPMLTEPAAENGPVSEAQELLTKLGFNVGTPDGQMGSRTANAIRLFQLQSGMKVTGEISPELLDAMRAKAG